LKPGPCDCLPVPVHIGRRCVGFSHKVCVCVCVWGCVCLSANIFAPLMRMPETCTHSASWCICIRIGYLLVLVPFTKCVCVPHRVCVHARVSVRVCVFRSSGLLLCACFLQKGALSPMVMSFL
jgi:hypothetical protein